MSTSGNTGWLDVLRDPLLVKEVRTRMRARTVVIASNLYVLAVCAIVLFSLFVAGSLSDALGWQIGSSLFKTITYTQAFLMLFVSPLVAASAVTGEVEQKTWDSLRAAPVTPARIVGAKLAAAIGCFLMLIVVSLPITCISFILGGVAPADMLIVYLYTTLCTLTAGAMGLYWSTRFERSIASIPAATITAVLALILSGSASGAGLKAIAMACPGEFLQALSSDAGIPFFGMECPAWVPGFLFLAAMFFCLVVASVVRLTDRRRRRHVLRRASVLLLLALATVFVAAEQVTPDPQAAAIRGSMGRVLTIFLFLWTATGLWVGASVPVTHSEPRRGIARLLTSPGGFVLLLSLVSAPVLGTGLAVCQAPLRVWSDMLPLWAGPVFLSCITWTLVAECLAGNGSPRRRYAGLAAAVLIALIFIVTPFAVFSAVASSSENGVAMPVQIISLLSPLTAIWHAADSALYTRHMKGVVELLGKHGPVLATGAFYLLTSGLLLLRRMARRSDAALSSRRTQQ